MSSDPKVSSGIAGAVSWGVIGGMVAGPWGAVIGAIAGGLMGYYLADMMQPDYPAPGKPETSKFDVPTAEEGIPKAELFGTTILTGNIMGYWHIHNITYEGSSRIDWFATWIMGLCIGPIDTLYAIYKGDKCVWSGELNGPDKQYISLDGMGNMEFYFGSDDQVIHNALTRRLDDSTLSPNYRHLCFAFFNDNEIGHYNRIPNMKFVIQKSPDCGFDDVQSFAVIEQYQYNPAHAIWGIYANMLNMGTYLDAQSFDWAAYQLYYEGIGISCLIKTSQEALSYIDAILNHIDGVLLWGTNGKLQLELKRENIHTEDMLLIDESIILDEPEIERKTWIETYNEIKIQFSRLTISDRSTSILDPVLTLQDRSGLGASRFLITEGKPPFTIEFSDLPSV